MTDKEVNMDEILAFRSIIWDNEDYQETVKGEEFRALMELCFDRADHFSLCRTDWPGAKDGPLERALRPYRLGEYLSYGRLIWFGHEAWEKCYVYPANQETKAIFLSHITHLFGRDVERPDGSDGPPEKYKACVELSEAAYERVMERVEAEEAIFGAISDEDFAAIEEEELQEAKKLWEEVFDEADFDSNLEDPWFFRGDDLFFRTITHEYDCLVHVPDEDFGERIKELGRWVDVSDRRYLRPLGFLSECQGLTWYEKDGQLAVDEG